MTYEIRIAGGNVTNFVQASSVSLTTSKNATPSQMYMTLYFTSQEERNVSAPYADNYVEDDYVADDIVTVPETGQTIEFFNNGTIEFGGKIMKISRQIESETVFSYSLECQDYSRIAQKGSPVAEIYEDRTAEYIIKDIVDRYEDYSSLNADNISCDIELDYVFIDHKTLWQVLATLSDRTGYDYYITPDKEIKFYEVGSISGQTVTNTNEIAQKGTINIKEDLSSMFNSIIVEGDTYDGSEIVSESITGDGGTEYSINNQYSGVSVTLNGVNKTVGTYGLHLEELGTTYQCLYDYSGRKIVFPDASPPAEGDAIVLSGNQKLLIKERVSDFASVTKYGIVEKSIKDTSLKTRDSAKQYAKAELAKYAKEIESGSFRTQVSGFRAGQRISISYMGETASFDIQRTSTTYQGESFFETVITFASAEIVDSIKTLTDLLNAKNRSSDSSNVLNVLREANERVGVNGQLEVNQNRFQFSSSVGINDVLTYEQDLSEFEYVYGDYYPADPITDRKRTAIFDVSTYA